MRSGSANVHKSNSDKGPTYAFLISVASSNRHSL